MLFDHWDQRYFVFDALRQITRMHIVIFLWFGYIVIYNNVFITNWTLLWSTVLVVIVFEFGLIINVLFQFINVSLVLAFSLRLVWLVVTVKYILNLLFPLVNVDLRFWLGICLFRSLIWWFVFFFFRVNQVLLTRQFWQRQAFLLLILHCCLILDLLWSLLFRFLLHIVVLLFYYLWSKIESDHKFWPLVRLFTGFWSIRLFLFSWWGTRKRVFIITVRFIPGILIAGTVIWVWMASFFLTVVFTFALIVLVCILSILDRVVLAFVLPILHFFSVLLFKDSIPLLKNVHH